MESLAKSDVFFIVTTGMVVILGALLAILIIYLIKTIKIFKKTLENLKQGVEAGNKYFTELGNKISKQGALFTLIKGFIKKKK